MRKYYFIGAITLGLMVTALAVRPRVVAAGTLTQTEQVTQLLGDAKAEAYQLSMDASTMESYTRSTANWEAHSAAIERIKEDVNAAGRTITKLDNARSTAMPWQVTAIDRVKPLLKEIAANTTAVIGYIKANPSRLTKSEYKDYIEANSDLADRLAGLIKDFVDYGNTKERLDRLAAKLELPEK